MFIFVDSLNNLDEFIKKEASLYIIASYYVSLLPIIVNQIMPAACLMSALYLLGHLNKQNEITAMKATGISGARILWPILLVGLTISIAVLAMNETVTPHAATRSAAIKKGLFEFGRKDPGQKTLSNVTLVTQGNRLVFAREMRLDTQTLHDIIILDQRPDLSLRSKTTAQKGVYQDHGWTLYEVRRYEFDRTGAIANKPELEEKTWIDIDEKPQDFIRQDTEAKFLNYQQLKTYIKNTRITGFEPSPRLLFELYLKIASPFSCLVILFVGTPLALRLRRGGPMLNMGIGILIVSCYYLVIAVFTALGKGGSIPPALAAWLPQALFLIAGLRLIMKYT